MNKNRLFVLLIILLLTVSLSACKKNLPAPEVTPSPPVQVPTDDIGQTIAQNLTQTALALITPGTPVAPGETVVVPEATQPVVAETPALPPTATSVPPPVPTIAVPASYTLQGGEFPFCIARRFDVDPGELLRVNNLSNTSTFFAGMNLNIPQSGRGFPGQRALRPHPTTYTVQSGDTIYKIACYYGDVFPEAIAAVNSIPEPYKLTVGQNLNIP